MAREFDVNIDLLSNKILGLALEAFDNLSLPASAVESRFAYHSIVKVPIYYDGAGWQELATRLYVNQVLEGLAWKDDVRVATTVDETISTALVPGQTIDDIVLVLNDRVLVFNQADQTENGIYVSVPTPIRSTDLDESSEFNNAITSVGEGTTYAGTSWRCETLNPLIGTTAITFTSFGSGVPDATEVIKGKLAFATDAEAEAGIATLKALTPFGMNLVTGPMQTQLAKLIPTPPQDLSGLALVMTLYTALEESTGSTINDLTDDTTPDGQVDNFYDGDAGTLTAEVDATPDGDKILTTSSDVGTYTSLVIIADDDPYIGQSGKEGFYKQLTAKIQAALALSLGVHTYQLKHTLTGNSALLLFTVDNPGTPTAVVDQIILPALTRYVSGVPSLATGDGVTVDTTISDAVKTHYRDGFIARIDSNFSNSLELFPVGFPANGADLIFTGDVLSASAGIYSETINVSVFGVNSKGTQGVATPDVESSRIDTVSDESIRVISGSSEFPTTGYGGVYDSAQDLKTTYTEELQLLNDKFQRPTGNYTLNLPTAGPDYSSGMGIIDRWVTFKFAGIFSNTSGFTLNLIDSENFSGIETADVKIYAKVEGDTDWVDCNAAYPGVGSPEFNGDPAMIFASSTVTEKKITFGSTPRTGDLFIRVAFPDGSTKKLGSVTVTDII